MKPHPLTIHHPDSHKSLADHLAIDAQQRSSALHYCFGACLFIIYGVQVCPFLEALERPFFVSVVAGLFCLMFIARHVLQTPYPNKSLKHYFLTELGIFVSGGLVLAIGNSLVYGFPIGAGLRVTIGFSLLGFLISLLLTLYKEYQIILSLSAESKANAPFKPITLKIQQVTLTLLVSAIITLLLIVYKDFDWLQTIGRGVSLNQASLWILYEFLFVCAVFIGYGFAISQRFANNLQLYFSYQNATLAAVEKGERDVQVPVINNNEFGTMANYTNHMIKSLSLSENALKQSRDATILAISSLAEARDNETGAHIIRTQEYVKALGVELQKHPKFSATLTDEVVELIYKSAPLHDIGKVGIPDNILLKPGKLTDAEFAVMKTHPMIGLKAIEKTEEQVGPIPFLHYAKEISIGHHERWDGNGYPQGLKGDAIPLSARLMALADVYDALISKRVYKPAFSHDKAKGIIIEGKGQHFDPDVVDAFVKVEAQFIEISKRYKDSEWPLTYSVK